jgi:hypothetical protein
MKRKITWIAILSLFDFSHLNCYWKLMVVIGFWELLSKNSTNIFVYLELFL